MDSSIGGAAWAWSARSPILALLGALDVVFVSDPVLVCERVVEVSREEGVGRGVVVKSNTVAMLGLKFSLLKRGVDRTGVVEERLAL